METLHLTEILEHAVDHVQVTDVFGSKFHSTLIKQLYDQKRQLPITAPAAIAVGEHDLSVLMAELEKSLGCFKSDELDSVGNGLYLLKGSSSSPRLPTVEDYARILLLASTRIGGDRVAELVTGWIEGKAIRYRICGLLKGILTDQKIEPQLGLSIETLSSNDDQLPRSLRLGDHEHWSEQYTSRAMLTLEYEVHPALYDPNIQEKTVLEDRLKRAVTNTNLSNISLDSFTRALALEINNQVDWFICWEDYGDVEAFFLNPSFSSQRKEVKNFSSVIVTIDDVKGTFETHSKLESRHELDLAIGRWRRSLEATNIYDQLIELRIALELCLLNNESHEGEKRHRLAMRGAWLLGATYKERSEHFKLLRDTYDHASMVIHGGLLELKKHDSIRTMLASAQELCRNIILLHANKGFPENWLKVVFDGDRQSNEG